MHCSGHLQHMPSHTFMRLGQVSCLDPVSPPRHVLQERVYCAQQHRD